jgi:hypothetical protein
MFSSSLPHPVSVHATFQGATGLGTLFLYHLLRDSLLTFSFWSQTDLVTLSQLFNLVSFSFLIYKTAMYEYRLSISYPKCLGPEMFWSLEYLPIDGTQVSLWNSFMFHIRLLHITWR